MNLIPIVYNSLLIFSGLFLVILFLSYISSKFKRSEAENIKTPNIYPNEYINYKKPMYTNLNTSNYVNNTDEYKEVRPQYVSNNNNSNNAQHHYENTNKRFRRYNTKSFENYDEGYTFSKIYYGNSKENYNSNSVLSHYAEF